MRLQSIVLGVLLAFALTPVRAETSKVRPFAARFYVSSHASSPDQVNSEIKAQGLDSFGTIPGLGVEVAFHLIPMTSVGIMSEWRSARVAGTATPSASPTNPYFSSLQQQLVGVVARLDLVDTSFAKLDLFGAVGGANTTLDIRSASGEGTYRHRNGSSFVSRYGASAGLGFGNVLIYLELGREMNNVSDLERLGSTAGGINSIDLSGNYASFGLLFSGSPSFVKMGKAN